MNETIRMQGKILLLDNNGNVLREVPVNHHAEYYHAVLDAVEISAAKNHDYCGGEDTDPLANFKECERFGISPQIGLWVRMLDKIGRIKTFLTRNELRVPGESAIDAFKDLGNYSFLMIALMSDQADYNRRHRTVSDKRIGDGEILTAVTPRNKQGL